jgi:hypothetical protein
MPERLHPDDFYATLLLLAFAEAIRAYRSNPAIESLDYSEAATLLERLPQRPRAPTRIDVEALIACRLMAICEDRGVMETLA